jgi:hypothetical protein
MFNPDEYIKKINKREVNILSKQKREGIKECNRILKLLRRKRFAFKKERDFIERRMIPYITRMKWMPGSYGHMLEAWENRYNE